MVPRADADANMSEIAIGIGVPLALIAIAYGLIVLGNAAVTIGPLDRATFGWLVPMPLWSISPVVAAYLWRRMSGRRSGGIALGIGIGLASVSTWMIFTGWAASSCEYGLNRSATEFLAEALPVGVVIGLGWAVVAFETRHLVVRGHQVEAALLGSVGGFALIFLAIGAGVLSNLFLPVCNRPL